ncbi:hypothetical protein MSP8887_02659 [Marinomonas spartinae]|uniref:hypothetical protein n=1 Tax=Marinomonas spartinae TaxID=1792290 RepID=UPI0008091735|nr:hypothetical protein [Marinomonas spartinae]SBS36631.1 hypothetical protein MSP8887_02659 [Marinomonas spartinae]
MKGSAKILNTSDDLAMSPISREQIIKMATVKVRIDKADYPEEYDKTLKSGDDGYIEPDYQYDEKIDQAVLDRFGIIH